VGVIAHQINCRLRQCAKATLKCEEEEEEEVKGQAKGRRTHFQRLESVLMTAKESWQSCEHFSNVSGSVYLKISRIISKGIMADWKEAEKLVADTAAARLGKSWPLMASSMVH